MLGIKTKFPRARLLRDRLFRNRRGAVAVEFALLFPVVILLTFGIIELSLVAYDYHRLGEATRRGAREVIISPTIPSISGYAGATITCGASGGGSVTCSGAAVDDDTAMTTMLTSMRQIQPDITIQNIQIIYEDSGLSPPGSPDIVVLLITVRLINMTYDFFLLNTIAGLTASIPYPDFATTILSPKLIAD